MDKSTTTSYESPVVEVIELNVEKGFAASTYEDSIGGWNDGGEFNGSFDI